MKKRINERGVTIITLVITIIILLILASVSIGLIFNNDGLFEKTSNATNQFTKQKSMETLEMTLKEAKIMKYSGELDDVGLNESLNKIGLVDQIDNTKVLVQDYVWKINRDTLEIEDYLGNDNETIIACTTTVEGFCIKIKTTGSVKDSGTKILNYTISPTEGLIKGKENGTIRLGQTEEIISTLEGKEYKITLTDNEGNIIENNNDKEATVITTNGMELSEIKSVITKDNLYKYVGTIVKDYNSPSGGTWRVFYYDADGYFGLENKLYLRRDYDSKCVATDMKKYNNYISKDNGELMKKMNPLWAKSEMGNKIDSVNEYSASWLNDSTIWNNNVNIDNAKFAIGGASVEMLIKSYNAWAKGAGYSTSLECTINTPYGYSVLLEGNEVTQFPYGNGNANVFIPTYHCWLGSPYTSGGVASQMNKGVFSEIKDGFALGGGIAYVGHCLPVVQIK